MQLDSISYLTDAQFKAMVELMHAIAHEYQRCASEVKSPPNRIRTVQDSAKTAYNALVCRHVEY